MTMDRSGVAAYRLHSCRARRPAALGGIPFGTRPFDTILGVTDPGMCLSAQEALRVRVLPTGYTFMLVAR